MIGTTTGAFTWQASPGNWRELGLDEPGLMAESRTGGQRLLAEIQKMDGRWVWVVQRFRDRPEDIGSGNSNDLLGAIDSVVATSETSPEQAPRL